MHNFCGSSVWQSRTRLRTGAGQCVRNSSPSPQRKCLAEMNRDLLVSRSVVICRSTSNVPRSDHVGSDRWFPSLQSHHGLSPCFCSEIEACRQVQILNRVRSGVLIEFCRSIHGAWTSTKRRRYRYPKRYVRYSEFHPADANEARREAQLAAQRQMSAMQRQGHRGGGQDMSVMLYMQMQQHEQQMQVCNTSCALFTFIYTVMCK